MNKTELIEVLKTHLDYINNLQYKYQDYSTAAILYQRTKMFAEKYFPQRSYRSDLIPIRFKPIAESIFTTEIDYKKAWNNGIIALQGVAAAMYDDLLLSPLDAPQIKFIEDTSKIQTLTEKLDRANDGLERIKTKIIKRKRVAFFITYIVVLSIILWTFNLLIKWQWLSNHSKRIPIYLAFQLLIIISSLRFISKNKAIKYLDWGIAIVIAILSFI